MVQEEKDMFTEIEDIKKLDIRSMMFDELAVWERQSDSRHSVQNRYLNGCMKKELQMRKK